MLIDEKRLMRNYTLKPTYPENIAQLNAQDVYKQWFIYAMIGINKHVELLHKQLIRKGRAATKSVEHPLYNNAYIVTRYNIKSPSTNPYNRDNGGDLGLNQFFVGQSPYKHYVGDPSGKDGIYHDICEIRPNYSLGKMPMYMGFPSDLILLFDKNKALKYPDKGFYYVEEGISFKDILNKALKNISYNTLINDDKEIIVLAKAIRKNDEWVHPCFDDMKIPSVKIKAHRQGQAVDVSQFCDDFIELNKNVFRIEKTDVHHHVLKRHREWEEPVSVKETIPFLEAFKVMKERYKCKYATPLCFYKNFHCVCYEEPYIALENSSRRETECMVYPLFRKGSNLPYGRRDRWLALWDSFYYLYVYEASDKGILSFFVPVLSIVLAVATWYTGGQGAWIGKLLGVSGNVAAMEAISAVTLGITLGLTVGALTGNKTFITLNAIWGLVNFTGDLSSNNFNLTVDFAKNTARIAQEMTSFEATLNLAGNLLSGASKVFNVIQSITADTPNMINEKSDDDAETDSGNGSEAMELVKDIINPTVWYDFETEDILNEVPRKRENPVFIF